jgi:hypothetical protein
MEMQIMYFWPIIVILSYNGVGMGSHYWAQRGKPILFPPKNAMIFLTDWSKMDLNRIA